MFIFFGTRSSKIKTRKLQGPTECPHCQSQDSFFATTFGKYFHVFWIPILPFSKTTLVECAHCKKTYRTNELPENIQQALHKTDEQNPVKRPIWHSLGCLVVVAFFGLSIILSIVGIIFFKANRDIRENLLDADIEQLTNTPDQGTDAVSYHLKDCIIDEIEGIDTNEIEYYSKIEEEKLLVLLNIKKGLSVTEAVSRKQIVFAVEDCLKHYVLPEVPMVGTRETYIGVKDKLSFVLIKTPDGEDMDGTFADKKLLFTFYGDKPVKE